MQNTLRQETMRASDYQDIGQYLRESRESLRISIQQAAMDLHIRAKYLEALEIGDLSELPGKSYTRGYIKNYAQYLRLNVGEVLDSYAELLGPKVSEIFVPEVTLRQNIPTNWLLWLSLGGLALLYSCWYFAFHDSSNIDRKVADVPANFMHRSDVPMDRQWNVCLSSDDEGCFARLMIKSALSGSPGVYDDYKKSPFKS